MKDDIVKKVLDFVKEQKGEGQSTRTVDVIPSIDVLLCQFLCLLKSKKFAAKITDEDAKRIFTDQEQLQRVS